MMKRESEVSIYEEVRDGSQHGEETRDGSQHDEEMKDGSQYDEEMRDGSQHGEKMTRQLARPGNERQKLAR